MLILLHITELNRNVTWTGMEAFSHACHTIVLRRFILMKIRKKSSDAIIAIVYFLTSLAISMASFSAGELELIQRISNSYFSDSAMSIESSEIASIDFSKDLLSGNALFFKEAYGIYSVYFTGHFYMPMTSGRFFMPDDFEDSLPKAVVGKDIPTHTSSDGKSIFTYGTTDYEVIGIAGINKSSRLDNSVYLSMPPQAIGTKTGVFILDGPKVRKNINMLKEKYYLSSNKLENLGIQRIFESHGTSFQGLFKAIGLIFLISILAITSYWFLQKRKLVLILKLCGLTRLKILGILCMEYAHYALSSFAAGTVFAYLFISPLFSYPFDITNHLTYLSAGMVFCLVPALILNLRWANQSMGRYQR